MRVCAFFFCGYIGPWGWGAQMHVWRRSGFFMIWSKWLMVFVLCMVEIFVKVKMSIRVFKFNIYVFIFHIYWIFNVNFLFSACKHTDEITSSFRRFGPLVVDWPHKAESKSYFPPKGYAFLLFQVRHIYIFTEFFILKILLYYFKIL